MIIVNYYEKNRRYHTKGKWLNLTDIKNYILSGEEVRVISKKKDITAITLAKVLALVVTDKSCDDVLKIINKENTARKKKNRANMLAAARICRSEVVDEKLSGMFGM